MSARSSTLPGPLVLLLLGLSLALLGCPKSNPGPTAVNDSPFDVSLDVPVAEPPTDALVGGTHFTDVHEQRQLNFTYDNGARGELLMCEATGGGAAWLDVDRDGNWDLYLGQGGNAGEEDRSGQPTDRLFRNLAGQRFEDITELAHIDDRWYGQGVSVGDFDDDGFDDLYVTNVGTNRLFRNMGDGTFLDVTEEAGVGDDRWSSSSSWGDLDLDGDLDLYVCNYTIYDPLDPIICRNDDGEPSICHPRDVEAWPDECYYNQGDGTFRAEAVARGLFGTGNKALSAVIADFNNDHRPDIYVANDTMPNFLFLQRADGKFDELATLNGCAVDRTGARQASMGLAVGDYDRNGFLDLYSTHFHQESNTLYKNRGHDGFEDVTGIEGLHQPTMGFLAFGTVMEDFDLDGRLELLVTNGHIEPKHKQYRMHPQLFEFNGQPNAPRWFETDAQAGDLFRQLLVGRGMATCDFDNDGDVDAVIVHQNEPTALLENDSPNRGHWLQIQLIGTQSNRRGIGTVVEVESAVGRQYDQLVGGSSFAAGHQPILPFGLGDSSQTCTIRLRWPSGAEQILKDVPVDQRLVVTEPSS